MGYTVGNGKLVLDVRYGYGLSNLNGSENSDEFKATNRGFGISFGYVILLGQ